MRLMLELGRYIDSLLDTRLTAGIPMEDVTGGPWLVHQLPTSMPRDLSLCQKPM